MEEKKNLVEKVFQWHSIHEDFNETGEISVPLLILVHVT